MSKRNTTVNCELYSMNTLKIAQAVRFAVQFAVIFFSMQ